MKLNVRGKVYDTAQVFVILNNSNSSPLLTKNGPLIARKNVARDGRGHHARYAVDHDPALQLAVDELVAYGPDGFGDERLLFALLRLVDLLARVGVRRVGLSLT
jgi:hypothetical protein